MTQANNSSINGDDNQQNDGNGGANARDGEENGVDGRQNANDGGGNGDDGVIPRVEQVVADVDPAHILLNEGVDTDEEYNQMFGSSPSPTRSPTPPSRSPSPMRY